MSVLTIQPDERRLRRPLLLAKVPLLVKRPPAPRDKIAERLKAVLSP